jgi:hypothetical protein
MANWFKNKKDEEVPERLRDKTPEQLAKELEDAEVLKQKIAQAETDAANAKAALQKQNEEAEKMKLRLATLEAAAKPNQTTTTTNDEAFDFDAFAADPSKVLQAQIDKRTAPITQVAIQNAMQTARILAQQTLNNQDIASGGKTMDGRLFQAWAAEIDAQVKNYNQTQMITPQAWLGVYMFIKGTHADELADPEARKKKYGGLEPVRTNVTPQGDGGQGNADQLTDQEKKIAERMGVTPENYLKRKRAMSMSAA